MLPGTVRNGQYEFRLLSNDGISVVLATSNTLTVGATPTATSTFTMTPTAGPPTNMFFTSRRRHTRYWRDWSSVVCSSDRVTVSWAGVTNASAHDWLGVYALGAANRSEERRVGKECRCRGGRALRYE